MKVHPARLSQLLTMRLACAGSPGSLMLYRAKSKISPPSSLEGQFCGSGAHPQMYPECVVGEGPAAFG